MPSPPRPPRCPTAPADLRPGAAGVDRLRLALERAERDFVAQVVADGGIGPWRRRVEGRFRSARDALARSGASRAKEGRCRSARDALARSGVSGAESAALVVALLDRAVRDRCWRQVDADPTDGWLVLWRHLARRALPPYRTEPLFLLAWTAWRRGDLATARVALGCARVEDPAHRASRLLSWLLSTAIDPRLLPSLAADRPAHRAAP